MISSRSKRCVTSDYSFSLYLVSDEDTRSTLKLTGGKRKPLAPSSWTNFANVKL